MSGATRASSVRRPRTRARTLELLAANADARAALALGILFATLAALTWGKWGVPAIDAGADLTAADRVAHGALAYGDVRYFYGPAGLYSLAAAFDLFGVSFTTAFVFGLAQAAATVAAFYLLARRLLPTTTAFLATTVVLCIGFSGTAFNFILPHTNSATFGTLFVLLMLLALSHERMLLAGLAAGVVGLTRPEFAAVAALAGLAYLVGVARQRGVRSALRSTPALALPALALAGGVLAIFCAQAGTAVVLTENLWPVDFIRTTGFASQGDWAPFDLASLASTVARAVVYCSLLAALVMTVLGVQRAHGRARLAALWPLAAAGSTLIAGDLLWKVSGVFPAARAAVQEECTHLLIGMSWLPALGFAAAIAIAVRFLRGGTPPLTSSWGFDLALVGVAAALGSRAYDAFTAEGSYAPYYAAPLVLLLAILHQRIADRWPEARVAALAALGAVAVGLATYALVALYPDHDTAVHTPRGTFVTDAASARAFQTTIDSIVSRTRPGQPILALPADAGLYFMSGRAPALYDMQFLPGLLESVRDERLAIARLKRERIQLAVIGNHRFVGYGVTTFGQDYNRLLAAWLRRHGRRVEAIGTRGYAAAGTNPARAFDVLSLTP